MGLVPAPFPPARSLLAGALAGLGLRPAHAQPGGYAGTWLTEDGASKVEITVAGSGGGRAVCRQGGVAEGTPA